jgi:hypothetical protein
VLLDLTLTAARAVDARVQPTHESNLTHAARQPVPTLGTGSGSVTPLNGMRLQGLQGLRQVLGREWDRGLPVEGCPTASHQCSAVLTTVAVLAGRRSGRSTTLVLLLPIQDGRGVTLLLRT